MKVKRLNQKYLQELGHRIKLLRTMLKSNQKELAAHLQTAPSQISKMERGEIPPNLYHLLRIKELVDQGRDIRGELSWNWLLHGKGNIFES